MLIIDNVTNKQSPRLTKASYFNSEYIHKDIWACQHISWLFKTKVLIYIPL